MMMYRAGVNRPRLRGILRISSAKRRGSCPVSGGDVSHRPSRRWCCWMCMCPAVGGWRRCPRSSPNRGPLTPPLPCFLALSVSDAPQDVGSVDSRRRPEGDVTKTITGADLIFIIKQGCMRAMPCSRPKLAVFCTFDLPGEVPAAGSDGGADGAARAHEEELDRLSAASR